MQEIGEIQTRSKLVSRLTAHGAVVRYFVQYFAQCAESVFAIGKSRSPFSRIYFSAIGKFDAPFIAGAFRPP
jgi:hypothetical protein